MSVKTKHTLFAQLGGLVAPVPVLAAIKGEPVPMALTTREELPGWCERHGYGPEQAAVLNRLIQAIVHTPGYRKAVALDLSRRMTLDGSDAGAVSEADRLSSAKLLLATALASGNKVAPIIEAKALSDMTEPVPVPVAAKLATETGAGQPAGMLSAKTPDEPVRLTIKSVLKAPAAARPMPVAKGPTPFPPAIRNIVERAGIRRNAPKLMAIHERNGNAGALAVERAEWVREAMRAVTTAGYTAIEKQIDTVIDDLLTGVVRRTGTS